MTILVLFFYLLIYFVFSLSVSTFDGGLLVHVVFRGNGSGTCPAFPDVYAFFFFFFLSLAVFVCYILNSLSFIDPG